MTIPALARRPALRRAAAIAGAAMVTVVGVVSHTPQVSAAGANAGAAEVVTPIEDGNTPLSSGGSSTRFSLKLPMGAACKGDSANGNYRVQSYMVPASVDPSTLTFGSEGPIGGVGFRQPLYITDTSPYASKQTANADTPGGPGLIINIPAFSYAVYQPGPSIESIPPDTYNIGIACTLGPAGPDQIDKFFNVQKTFTADPADSPAQLKWVVGAAAAPTTTSLAASPSASAAVGADVTLTATVSPSDAMGAVTFMDGTTVLNTTPVPVSSGKATLTTKTLKAGPHTFTASFAPSGAALAASTSAGLTYAITDPTTTSSSSTSTSTSTSTSGGRSGGGTGGGGGTAAASNPGGQLAKTGTSPIVALTWAFFLVCTGRAVVLLCRRPTVRTRSPR